MSVVDHTPETGPEGPPPTAEAAVQLLHAQPGSTEPFFNPQLAHTPIDEIDLSPITEQKRWDFSTASDSGLNIKRIAAFITTATSGPMDEATFNELLSRTTGRMLEGVSVDDISTIYDVMEKKQPRLIELLARIRKEELYSPTHMVSVNKFCLVFGANRYMQENA